MFPGGLYALRARIDGYPLEALKDRLHLIKIGAVVPGTTHCYPQPQAGREFFQGCYADICFPEIMSHATLICLMRISRKRRSSSSLARSGCQHWRSALTVFFNTVSLEPALTPRNA